MYAGLV